MAANYFAPAFSVQINRANLREDVSKYIVEVSITHEPDTMDHCSLTIANPYPAMPWIQTGEANPFQAGNEIAIKIGYVDYLRPAFEGTITSVSPTFPAGGMPTVQIEGYTRMYELQRSSRTRTFLGKTDREIAQEIADDLGLTLDTDLDEGDSMVSTTYPYLIQYDKTDMAFLLERARRSGFEIQVEGKSLILREPKDKQAPTYTLVWGHPARPIDPASKVMPLQHFSPTLNTLRKVGAVVVRGEDLGGQKIEGQAGPDDTESQAELEDAEDPLGGAESDGNGDTVIVVDMPVASQEEAEQLAQSIYDDLAREYITGSGATIGLPDLRAGRLIALEGLGDRFSSQYYVTQATHTISSGGYQTSFVVNRMGWSLLDLISSDSGQVGGRASSRINGVVTGIVTNNQDQDGLGRVKVRFPWLDDQVESWWARIATPMAGKQRGAYFLPEVGDEVLVAFDHGDVRFPYVLGGLWNSANQPPTTNTDGANNMRVIQSRSGHIIRLDDTVEGEQPKGKIEIIDSSGQNKIVINSADNSIMISGQGDVTIASAGKLTLSGKQGVELTSPAEIKVAADGQTIIKGAQVHINDPE
jgi:uncharacterized protein